MLLPRLSSLALGLLLLAPLGLPTSASANPVAPTPLIVNGDTLGTTGVTTWAKVLPNNRVTEVGLTLRLSFVANPPSPGPGPDGQYVLSFPAVVQATTYFNHLELGWNPHGHEPRGVFDVPHFDFHFESVPVADVFAIGFGDGPPQAPHDPVAPASERIPAGYMYPSQFALVPFMGVHAVRPDDIVPSDQFTTIMIAGFFNGNMIFMEPMITQRFLLLRQSFTLDVPMPAVLGRTTHYPSRFRGIYDKKTDAFNFVFDKFVTVQ